MIWALFVLGLAGLFLGGDWLVRGASGIARGLGVPPLVIGLTIVGFGTSAPEMLVSVQAALAGAGGIAIGNVLGSNIANILLILGVSALIWPIRVTGKSLRRDLAVMLAAAVLLVPIFALGQMGRPAGLILFAGLVAYLVWAYRQPGEAVPDLPGTMPSGLMSALTVPLNFEMAATDEMQQIALRHKPHAVCIVPEKREEKTTEGGLEVAREENRLAHFIAPLRDAGCRVSIFIAADPKQIEAAHRIGAQVIELHTGAYCDAHAEERAEDCARELQTLREMSAYAHSMGLEVHAGHGLTYDTVQPVAAFPEVRELNIGHFIIGEAIFRGLTPAIGEMRRLMGVARGPGYRSAI